jgi:hypothetical protein
MTARLIVRRVKDLSKDGHRAGRLFTAWRYHALFTDSPHAMLQAEEHHRGHAQAEQVFADWTDGPLAHLPSGSFPANAAWLALAAISCNLLRAAGCLASLAYAKARGASVRRDLIAVAARTARHGRGHLTLHLPEGWHREHEWMNLFEALRPATRYGLTSPDPVTASRRPAAASPAAKRTTRTSRRKVSGQTTCAGQPGRSRPPAYIRPKRAPHLGGGSRLSHSPPLALRGPPHLLHRQCDGRNSSGPRLGRICR